MISSDAKHFYTDGDVASGSYTPPTPTRDGYTFTGWSPASIPVGNKGDIIFTANWRENTLTTRYLSSRAEGWHGSLTQWNDITALDPNKNTVIDIDTLSYTESVADIMTDRELLGH